MPRRGLFASQRYAFRREVLHRRAARIDYETADLRAAAQQVYLRGRISRGP